MVYFRSFIGSYKINIGKIGFIGRLGCMGLHQLEAQPGSHPHRRLYNKLGSSVYAFMPSPLPPFNLISKTLTKVTIDQTELTPVAPVWQAQPWWPVLLRLLISQPALLPNSNSPILTDPTEPSSSNVSSPSLGRVSHLYQRFQTESIPTNVADLLIAATRTSTHKTYESNWNRSC